jgi:hypothetical protein
MENVKRKKREEESSYATLIERDTQTERPAADP